MEVKISKIEIGDILILSHNWKGYNFNDESNLWVKENELYKDEKGNLYPFCSTISRNEIVEIFENCPINKNNILVIRGDINNTFVTAYVLVGDTDIKNHEFETKVLM